MVDPGRADCGAETITGLPRARSRAGSSGAQRQYNAAMPDPKASGSRTFPRLRDVIASVIATTMPTLVHGCPVAYDKAYVVEMPTGASCERVCSSLTGHAIEGAWVSEIDECSSADQLSSEPDAGTREVAVCRATVYPAQGAGRRPPGLAPVEGARAASEEGSFFAVVAHLEAASVPAFERLAGELQAHGAPRALVRAALRARTDERRHARVTAKWRDRFGGEELPVGVRPCSARSLSALARDNAVEGCVRETWGAVLATVQSLAAPDAALRADLSRIARDESRHAALAWDVDAWASPRLRPRELRAARSARARAVARLERDLRDGPLESAPALARLGLPTRPQSLALFTATREALWS